MTKTPTSKRPSEAPSTTGRKKAKKDPDAPKRPLSAYLLFQNDKRSELIRANPQMSSTEITVLASHLWKNVYTEAQKQPYLDKETALREQYKIESAAYQAQKKGEPMEVDETEHSEVRVSVNCRMLGWYPPLIMLFSIMFQTKQKKLEKSPRRPKDPNAPKRPKTAFLVFNSDAQVRQALKAQFPAASPQEIMRLLGERWAAMTPHDKQPYEEIAQQEQAVYKVEKEAYDQKKAAADGEF
jgi:upstream-binding transcription factor